MGTKEKSQNTNMDDNASFWKLLSNFLSSELDIEVVGEVSGGEKALNQAK